MAQGCHLIYSNSDRDHFPLTGLIKRQNTEDVARQFQNTFNLKWNPAPSQGLVETTTTGIRIDEVKATANYNVPKEKLNTFETRFRKLKPRQQAMVSALLNAKADRQSDILTGMGNYNLNNDMANKIPEALNDLLKHDKNISGLFNKVRKGESTWISNMKNTGKGRADGIAYEVLASAKMLQTPINGISISPTDSLDFGIKLQASYGSGGDIKISNGESESLFKQPPRKTVEADLMITQTPLQGGKEIAVDFKHSIGTATIS